MQLITLNEIKHNFKNQSEIAEELHISRQAVCKWFLDQDIPKLRQYEIIDVLSERRAKAVRNLLGM